MAKLFDVHERLLKDAVRALEVRTFWTPFPEAPSGKVYGETAKADGLAAFEALLGRPLEIEGHPGMRRAGKEVSPWERELGISYPSADPETLVSAARAAGEGWAAASAEDRVGVCLEILVRLNRHELSHGARDDAHDRPGVSDGLPGGRSSRAGPGA